MITVMNSGTQAAVINTEHTLATETEARTYVLIVDLHNMVTGDAVELRVKTKVLTGSTARQVYVETVYGVQGNPNFISVPVPSAFSAAFTLKQTTGTGRSFDWAVIALD